MEEKNSQGIGTHKLLLQGRKTMELTGVKEVISFELLRHLKALAVIFKESGNFVICENRVSKEKYTPEIIKNTKGKVLEIKFSRKGISNTRNKFIRLLKFLCFTVYWVLSNYLFCVTIYNV